MRPTGRMAALVVLVAACGAPTTAPPTTPTTSPATAAPSTTAAASTTSVPGTTSAPSTTSALPTTTVQYDPGLTSRTWAVVLVTSDDVLNVRATAGASAPIITTLEPTAGGIVLTGRHTETGGSTWVEIDSGSGPGWVNAFYLTPEWSTAEVETVWDTNTPLDRLVTAMEAGGDLSAPVSRRGLFVVHFDGILRRFTPAQLVTVMSDPTLTEWGGTGCSPEECPDRTFADAVAASLIQVANDRGVDADVRVDSAVFGGNGPISVAAAIPTPFHGFHFLGVHDPGDDPVYGGIDWWTWMVFYDFEDGRPVVVGLVPAAWAP